MMDWGFVMKVNAMLGKVHIWKNTEWNGCILPVKYVSLHMIHVIFPYGENKIIYKKEQAKNAKDTMQRAMHDRYINK